MKKGDWKWLIAAAIFLYNAIVELTQSNWLTALASFLLAAVFIYATFK
jgi:hypothetical protein